jgi:ketosteroid isomerase-like protein
MRRADAGGLGNAARDPTMKHVTTLLHLLASLGLLPLIAAAATTEHGDHARSGASLDTIDQDIEDAVLRGDLRFLEALYVESLSYHHADGQADDKRRRLADVQRGGYLTRNIEDVHVEQHGDVGLTSGRLVVTRIANDREVRYAVRFLRVYARREGVWQLLSHRGLG